jgi:hypothetical protein
VAMAEAGRSEKRSSTSPASSWPWRTDDGLPVSPASSWPWRTDDGLPVRERREEEDDVGPTRQ